jgi:carotenoid cleavage dioxygenase-like enzyme
VDEDDGYLVTYVTNLNSGKGECAIFDARDITTGPICRIILPGHIPMGAHACWAPQSTLQVPEAA